MLGAWQEHQLLMQHRGDPLCNFPFLEPDHAEYSQFRALAALFALEQNTNCMLQGPSHGQEPLMVELREPPPLRTNSLL